MKCTGTKGRCVNNASEEIVTAQICEIFDGIKISRETAERIRDELIGKEQEAEELKRARMEMLRQGYDKLERNKGTMYDGRLDGRITTDFYDEKNAQIALRRQELTDEISRLEENHGSDEISLSYLLDLASRAKELFKSSKPAQKNAILRLVLSNLEINEKRLHFHLLEPFALLLNRPERPVWLPRPDSNWQPRS